jgi:hypothetical protein
MPGMFAIRACARANAKLFIIMSANSALAFLALLASMIWFLAFRYTMP